MGDVKPDEFISRSVVNTAYSPIFYISLPEHCITLWDNTTARTEIGWIAKPQVSSFLSAGAPVKNLLIKIRRKVDPESAYLLLDVEQHNLGRFHEPLDERLLCYSLQRAYVERQVVGTQHRMKLRKRRRGRGRGGGSMSSDYMKVIDIGTTSVLYYQTELYRYMYIIQNSRYPTLQQREIKHNESEYLVGQSHLESGGIALL